MRLHSMLLRLFIRSGNQYARSMNRGQWSPDFQTALDELLSLPVPSHPPVAVFDADGTLWGGDANENFLSYLDVQGLAQELGFQSIRLEYDRRCAQDKHDAYAWGAQVCAGMSEDRVAVLSQASHEASTAARIFEDMQDLVTCLLDHQWLVYVVSASPVWAVLPGAKAFGISANHVIGLDVERCDGVLTNQLKRPFSMGIGKVTCIDQYVGCVPWVVAGNSLDDRPMLDIAAHCRIVVNPEGEAGDGSSLHGMAIRNDWHILWTDKQHD